MENRRRRVRAVLGTVAALAAALLVASATALGFVSAHVGGSLTTVLLQAALVVAGLVGAAAMWDRTGPRTLVAIVTVALVARAVLVPWPPLQSNDLYRYLWDGTLLLHGIDPYVVAPDAPQLRALRAAGGLYAYIDWRSVPTLYPPLDLALYTLGAALSRAFGASVIPLKLVLLAGDIATVGLVAASLHARRLPLGRLALYAWSPLAIVEFGLNGHEESWAIAFLVATVLAFSANRGGAAAVALAGAVLTKLYPAAFVPALFARRTFAPTALVCIAIVAAAYAPFVFWHRDAFGFLHTFAFGYHFNDSLHRIVGTLGSAALFACALAVATVARARGASAIAIVLGLEIAYVLLSPNVYPWYLVAFAALLPLVTNAFAPPMRALALALVAWTALAPLAYLAPWAMPTGSSLDVLAHLVEYAPLAMAFVWYATRDARRLAAIVMGGLAVSGCATHAAPASHATIVARGIVERGAALYAGNCAICHTPTATSFIGPDLTGVASRRSVASLTTHIATSVPDGTTFSQPTVTALVAYLESLEDPKALRHIGQIEERPHTR